MSSDSYSSFYDNALTSNSCGLATLAFILCEYFIHLPREVEFFWKRKITGASVLFLSNRYISLAVQVFQNTAIGVTSEKVWSSQYLSYRVIEMVSDSSCLQYAEVTVTIALLPYFIWAAFSALRTYALCERHVGLGLGILVFLLSSVTIGINPSRYHWLGSAIIPTLGCFPDYALSEELDKNLTIVSRVCLIVADLVVLGVTLRGTYRTTQMARVVSDKGMRTFSGTLLLDGTIYFIILVTMNALHLLFTMLSISFDSLESASFVTSFTEPVTTVFVSRFILDLQEVEYRRQCADSQMSSVRFTKVLGSLGNRLPAPGDISREDEWEEPASDDHDVDEEDKEVHAGGAPYVIPEAGKPSNFNSAFPDGGCESL